MTKPTFVFVPGGWNTPDCYENVINSLSRVGFSSVKVWLPSVGGDPITSGIAEDISTIKKTITDLVNDGQDVVLVMHSYGGLPGSAAVEGLSKNQRSQLGQQGGVIRLVYLMAFMVPEGFQPSQVRNTDAMATWMQPNVEAGTVSVDKEGAKKVWFHDLSEQEAEFWVAKCAPMSIGVFRDASTYAGWRHISSTYIICSQDRSFPVQMAESLIESAIASGADVTTETLDAGHFAMLSKTDEVVEILKRAADGSFQ